MRVFRKNEHAWVAGDTWKPVADNPFFPPDNLQQELMATCHLLGEFGIDSSDENEKVLDLLSELKEMTQKKDLELRRYFRKYFKEKIALR